MDISRFFIEPFAVLFVTDSAGMGKQRKCLTKSCG